MRFGLIVGSHKKSSNSAKVADYIARSLPRLVPGASLWTYDLGKTPLPMWDEDVWAGSPDWTKIWSPISKELKSCTAFIVISPEYSGMVPAALKNFFLLCKSQEVGHKPGLIVGVSSSRGGTYPVVELRSSSYKNTRINWIPEHVIVRDADQMFNGDKAAEDNDIYIRSRTDYCIRLLAEYGKALASVRASGVIDEKSFPNGM